MAIMGLPKDKQFVCEGYQIINGVTHKFYLITRSESSHEVLIYADNGQIVSGYRVELGVENGVPVQLEKCYVNKEAKNIYANILTALKGCKQKENRPTMHTIGAATANTYKKKDKTCEVIKFMGELVELDFRGPDLALVVNFYGLVSNLKATTGVDFTNLGLDDLYVELKRAKVKKESSNTSEEEGDDSEWDDVTDEVDVPIRTLEEIALEKDITWLHNKKYYVINDEATAEQLLQAFEKWNGVISYDVETSGLKINMFGQVGSPKVQELEAWNANNPKERIKQDYLVGFSLTVEKDTGYYFPCAHRKFKNLYEDRSEGSYGRRLAERLKSEYTIGMYRERTDYMAQYIRSTSVEDMRCDVLLMERCRYIFETKDILAFNGIFEWKTTWLFSIDLNLREDPMVLHQLLYKFKRVRIGRGEPSNLKYLTKVECGVDQLDLADFFVGYKEDDSNLLRAGSASGKGSKRKKSKKGLNIDFSYMDLRGTQAYAPADVDFALAIWEKYKYDLIKNYPDMEYIYGVEIITACAVAYAEFYGLRINESKIEAVRKKNIVDIAMYEHAFRKMNGLTSPEEDAVAEQLKVYMQGKDEADDVAEDLTVKYNAIVKEAGNLNMGAPQQVGDLLYAKYNWALTEDGKRSMGKKVIKQYEKAQDENGKLLYPEVAIYRKYKDAMTLDSKFFGKLREFSYPGGIMFASFGSISCSTGRMSCSKPNLQQMPKSISKIIEPRDGYVFCDADFAQIELRVLVAMAEEWGLVEYFRDADADMHSKLASMLFELPFSQVDIPDETGKSPRQQCKGLNFGIPYGMGIASLAITLYGVATAQTKKWAKAKYDKYFEEMPKVRMFFDDIKEKAQVTEYSNTLFNRRRYYKFTDKDGNYSMKHMAMALRQAGNAVIQGTAADIQKIGIARNFMYVRQNKLLGRVLLVNFIHDEVLYEIETAGLNVNEVLGHLIVGQQVQIKNFPPLTVGAGIGKTWASAKGGMAEINPLLGNIIIEQGNTVDPGHTPEEVYAYYDNLNERFRKGRIRDYIIGEQQKFDSGQPIKDINPVMAKLMTLAFDNGVEKKMQAEAKEAGLSGEELEKYMSNLDARRLIKFVELNPDWIGDNNITWIDSILGKVKLGVTDAEEDTGYDDDEDEEGSDELTEYEFALIDESQEIYGLNVADIIEMFGLIVSRERKLCGVDVRRLKQNQLESLAQLFESKACEPNEDGAMEVVLMRQNRLMLRPGLWVKNINGSDIEKVSVA